MMLRWVDIFTDDISSVFQPNLIPIKASFEISLQIDFSIFSLCQNLVQLLFYLLVVVVLLILKALVTFGSSYKFILSAVCAYFALAGLRHVAVKGGR